MSTLWPCCGFPRYAATTALVSQLERVLLQTQSTAGARQPFPTLSTGWTTAPDLRASSPAPALLLQANFSASRALPDSQEERQQRLLISRGFGDPTQWLLEEGSRAPTFVSAICMHLSI